MRFCISEVFDSEVFDSEVFNSEVFNLKFFDFGVLIWIFDLPKYFHLINRSSLVGERDGLWILMWLSWLDTALGLQNDRQTDISSWYAIIRCDELYHVQILLSITVVVKKAWLFASFVMQQQLHVIFPWQKNYIITFLVRSNPSGEFKCNGKYFSSNFRFPFRVFCFGCFDFRVFEIQVFEF